MESIAAFLNKKYHPTQCCCCFSLKNGTTIIGVLEIIVTLVYIFFGDMVASTIYEDNQVVTMVRTESHELKVFMTIGRGLWIAAMIAMIYGNIKGNKKMMLIYIYMKIVGIIFSILVGCVMVLTCVFFVQFILGIFIMLFEAVKFVVDIYFWHVMACRVLEMQESTRAEVENVQSTKVQITGEPSAIPELKDPKNSSMSEIQH